MEDWTQRLWAKQDQHERDRWRLFRAVGAAVQADTVLYPGSYCDLAPSFVFGSVTYVDMDRRAARFFADESGVREIVASHPGAPADPEIRFLHGDYTEDLGLPGHAFDLLVSLYAGFVSEHCIDHLRVGDTLLVNPSHGDAAMASIDPRYELVAVVESRSGDYRVRTERLDAYVVPKKPVDLTPECCATGVAASRTPGRRLPTCSGGWGRAPRRRTDRCPRWDSNPRSSD